MVMTINVQAVYEHGILRPLEPVNLPENERVTITIAENAQTNSDPKAIAEASSISDDEFERLLDELASGPTLPHLSADFSRADVYADHD
jgi:predicted DNA-binding antitoxin AbrB/MazE fold protein